MIDFFIATQRLCRGDVEKISSLHRLAIPRSFMGSLGLDFLILFYDFLINNDPYTVSAIARIDNEIAGFAIFNTRVRGINLRFLKHLALKRTLSFLKLIPALSRNFSKSLNSFLYTSRCPDNMECEFISLAVEERHRKKGIGKKLILMGEDALRKRGVRIYRTMVGKGIDAHTFHMRMGMKRHSDITVRGKEQSIIYTKELC